MELYIYNRNLELQGVIDLYTSFRWVRRYSKPGNFELHCPLTSENLTLLSKDAIICKNDDDPEAGYVSYRGLSQDKEGKKVLVVKGKFLTGYLGRRIIWGTEIIKATTETAMRVLVSNNCITPQIAGRKIDNLILGDFGDYPETVDYQVSYKNLGDEVESLATAADLGYRVRFDRELKQLKFEVYKGLDRSVNQTANPQAIFSQEYENVLEQEYIESIGDYRNLALIGGIGEGATRKIAIVGDATGLDRFEVFCDQNNLSNVIEEKTKDGQTDDQIDAAEDARITQARAAYNAKKAELVEAQRLYEENRDIISAMGQEFIDKYGYLERTQPSVFSDKHREFQNLAWPHTSLMWQYWYLINGNKGNKAYVNAGHYPYTEYFKLCGDAPTDGLKGELEILRQSLEKIKHYITGTTQVVVTGSNTLTDEEYNLLLTEKGNETLSFCQEAKTFNGSINPNSNMEYRVDYDLGDIVTQLNNEWGVELDARITEIEEVYENKEMELNITFGNDVPTLIDKIKQLGRSSSGSGGFTSAAISNIDGGTF